MKTRFFFALPVVAMIVMTTTSVKAAECKAEVNKVVSAEVASVNKVDAGMDVKLAARLFPTYFGMDVDVKATSLACGSKLDAKTESGFLTARQKGLDAETSAEVALQGVRDQIGSGIASLRNKVDAEAGVKATTVAKRIYAPCPNMCGYTA